MKGWERTMGLLSIALFLVSTVMVSKTVQARNLAAGSYGYYGGTYGFNASNTTSDDFPAAPTSLTQTNVSTTSLTLTWTAPTTTTTLGTAISTGGGSIASYKVGYSTGTVSSCTSGTTATPTSATVGLTGLDSNTTYNVKICAVDNNQNTGTALSSTFVTASGGGASGGSGGSGGATSVFGSTPTTTTTTPSGNLISPVVSSVTVVADAAALTKALGVERNTGLETAAKAQVAAVVKKSGVKLSATDTAVATNYIAYGVDSSTMKLGFGERKNLVGEVLGIYGSLNLTTLTELAAGKKPTQRTLPYEKKQSSLVNTLLVKLMGHKIDFKVASQDLAYNSMIYPVRFPGRDLKKEGAAAAKFKKLIGKAPTSPLDWSGVRAIAYTGLKTR